MMIRSLICVTLATVLASGLAVADEKNNRQKRNKGRKAPTVTQRLLGKIELTAAQKEQVAAIDKQFAERFQDLQKKRQDILTEDQRKAQREVMAAGKKDGTKGAELRKSVAAALNLTDQQKAQQKELTGLQQKLNQEVVAALKKVLTPEQIEQLPKRGRAGDAKKKRKKKDAA